VFDFLVIGYSGERTAEEIKWKLSEFSHAWRYLERWSDEPTGLPSPGGNSKAPVRYFPFEFPSEKSAFSAALCGTTKQNSKNQTQAD